MTKGNIRENDIELARILKALANPVRLSMIRTLVGKCECCNNARLCTCGDHCEGRGCKCGCRCGEFVDLFPMSQSTVSQHIKELKISGLINSNSRKGNYTLNHSKLREGLISLLDLLGYNNNLIMENKDCKCGDNCNCGENCTCGPDCKCREGGECTCGPECKCG